MRLPDAAARSKRFMAPRRPRLVFQAVRAATFCFPLHRGGVMPLLAMRCGWGRRGCRRFAGNAAGN